jgi:hypothetical protein
MHIKGLEKPRPILFILSFCPKSVPSLPPIFN